jgi:hypothetical protein
LPQVHLVGRAARPQALQEPLVAPLRLAAQTLAHRSSTSGLEALLVEQQQEAAVAAALMEMAALLAQRVGFQVAAAVVALVLLTQ